MLYLALKTLHILSVAIGIGTNATYGFLLARGARDDAYLFALRTVAFLDAKVANTAYGLAFVTGAVLVRVGGMPWRTTWIATSITLFALTTVVGFGAYTPVLKAQAQALEEHGPDDPRYRRLEGRSRVLGLGLAAIVLAIVGLMVFKPA
jgi:uncharacterized membrane protein